MVFADQKSADDAIRSMQGFPFFDKPIVCSATIIVSLLYKTMLFHLCCKALLCDDHHLNFLMCVFRGYPMRRASLMLLQR